MALVWSLATAHPTIGAAEGIGGSGGVPSSTGAPGGAPRALTAGGVEGARGVAAVYDDGGAPRHM